MSRLRKLTVLLAVVALIAGACGTADTTTTTQPAAGDDGGTTGTTGTPDDDPIIFAASLPLTGDFAVPGQLHSSGYSFCIDEINRLGGLDGREVVYLGEDSQSDPEQTVAQIQRFIDVEGADILLGTFSSLLTFPATTVARDNGYVYPVPSGGALRIWERGYENIFYFQQNAAELIGFSPLEMVDYYVEQGIIDPAPASVAIVDADDFFASAIVTGLVGGEVRLPGGGDVIAQVEGFLNNPDTNPHGIEVAYQETWPIPFTDWNTLAQNMKDSGAEMVIAATASPDEAVSLAIAMATVDYQPKIVYMSQGAQNDFRDTLQGGEQHQVIHASWHPLANYDSSLAGQPYSNQDFIDGYTAANGEPPDEDVAIPFALCQGMAQAILGTGGTDQAAIQQWLHDRTPDDPVTTILGDFSWDERGLPFERSHIMVQWQDGELKFVYPVGDFPGTVDLVYPKDPYG